MKLIKVAVLAALAVPSLLAAAPRVTTEYLVATRGRAPHVLKFRMMDGEIERSVSPFRHINAFSVELTDEELTAVTQLPEVRWVEPAHEIRAAEIDARYAGRLSPAAASFGQNVPYGIDMVRARAVWSVGKGEGIKVAIIDTGIDMNHPDLVDRYRGGYDFVQNDATPQDENGHGTHVAGTIAASDNAQGVVGVAPLASLYSLRVLNANGSGSNAAEIKAVEWAITNHMNVINLSLGSPLASTLEEEVFDRAAEAGIIAIAASGNDPAQPVSYPGGYRSVLAIGAVDSAMKLASFTSTGAAMGVVAPGVHVLSTYPQGTGEMADVRIDSGTSLAASRLENAPNASVTGHFVYCGLGRPENIPSNVTGNIALIRRGDIPFADKVRNAKTAGALAVVVMDNNPNGDISGWTLGQDAFEWPLAVGISMEDGNMLMENQNATITVEAGPSDYDSLSGTSMATPHVAGLVALVWSIDPTASPVTIRGAIRSTAHDLGDAGFDNSYGNGLVDAESAARLVAPQKFQSRTLRTRRRK